MGTNSTWAMMSAVARRALALSARALASSVRALAAKGRSRARGPSLTRWLFNRCPLQAERRFKSLREPLARVKKEAALGSGGEHARSSLALRLEQLDIWPQAIRGERARCKVGLEADYLLGCAHLHCGLEIARCKFPKDGPQKRENRTETHGESMRDQPGRFQEAGNVAEM